jgi:hypothetical protein
MVRPRDLLDFARFLLAGKQISEMQARQAAARSYYGVLLLIRDQLRREGEIPNQNSHALVFSMLCEAVREPGADEYLIYAIQSWKTLKRNREAADYDIDIYFETHRGHESLYRAEKIFKAFDSI